MPQALEIVLLSGVSAYLLCSIPFAWLYGLAFGRDIRKEGSGNIGASNLIRALGLKGIPGLVLDVGKGFVAVVVVRYLVHLLFGVQPSQPLLFAVVLAGVIGHMFPVFLKFKGGKSIAVSGGGLLAIDPKLGAMIIGIWALLVILSDLVSIGSVASALLYPFYAWFLFGHNPTITTLAFLTGALVIWGHRSNMHRIKSGDEIHLGFIFKVGMWVVRRILSVKGSKVTGASSLPKGPYLLVANHLRNSDPFLIGSSTKRPVIFMAKKELWANPFVAYLMWLTVALKTDRGNVDRQTLDRAVQVLRSGGVLGVFPEEHRNRTPEKGLLEMKPGAAFIAARAGVNVVPVAISYPKGVPRIVFGEVITNPDNLDPEAKREVLHRYGVTRTRDALHAMIVEKLEEMTGNRVISTVV